MRAAKVLLALVLGPVLLAVLALLVLATTPWGNERARRLLVSQANHG